MLPWCIWSLHRNASSWPSRWALWFSTFLKTQHLLCRFQWNIQYRTYEAFQMASAGLRSQGCALRKLEMSPVLWGCPVCDFYEKTKIFQWLGQKLATRSRWALQVHSPGKCFVDEQMGNFWVAPSLCFKPRL